MMKPNTIKLTPKAKEALTKLSEALDRDQKAVASQIIEWIAKQDLAVQRLVVRHELVPDPTEIRKSVLGAFGLT